MLLALLRWTLRMYYLLFINISRATGSLKKKLVMLARLTNTYEMQQRMFGKATEVNNWPRRWWSWIENVEAPLKIKIFFVLKEWSYWQKTILLKRIGMVVRHFLANPKLSGTCFFDFHYASFLWCVVFVLFGIKLPRNTNHFSIVGQS